MKTLLPEEVTAYGKAASASFSSIGGVRLAYLAETDDRLRGEADAALTELGAWELDVRGDVDDLLAGAELCRAAGAAALPYPLVPQLLSVDGARVELVDPAAPRIDHGDLSGGWRVADVKGQSWQVLSAERRPGKLGPFVAVATLGDAAPAVEALDVDLALVLGSCRALGCAERSLELVRDHVTARVQFGKPLASFQSVRFAVADAVVAVQGLAELTKFTLSRVNSVSAAVRSADALVLRLKAIDTVRSVMRSGHQLLGAVGFCDEHDLSVLDRHIQPVLRFPTGSEGIAELLMPAARSGSLETLFSRPA